MEIVVLLSGDERQCPLSSVYLVEDPDVNRCCLEEDKDVSQRED